MFFNFSPKVTFFLKKARQSKKIFIHRKAPLIRREFQLIFLLAGLIIFFITFVFLINIPPSKTDNRLLSKNEDLTLLYWSNDYWKGIIDEVGPAKAYENLKSTMAKWTYSKAHQTLHVFGVALYEKFGLEGMNYCDGYQSFGCFHGFVASYLSDKGLSALNETTKICPRNQPLAESTCLHGIGHGLVDYLGKSHLNEAFRYCQKIGSMTYRGCPQGVIMEYFIPIHRQAQMEYSEFDENKLFGPCSELDGEFQKYCYTFVPLFYWPNTVIADPAKAESYCQTINQQLQQNMCLVSIGIRLSSKHDFDLESAWTNCSQMKALKSQVYCSVGVQWNGGARKQDIQSAEKFCDKLGEETKNCQDIINDLYSRKARNPISNL